MNDLPRLCVDRREWLGSTLRSAAVGGVTLVSAALLLRRASPQGQTSCRRALACRDCGQLADCRLTPALQAKGLSETGTGSEPVRTESADNIQPRGACPRFRTGFEGALR